MNMIRRMQLKKFNKKMLLMMIMALTAIYIIVQRTHALPKNYAVINGDTIIWNSKEIRLKGVNAPKIKQTCRNDSNQKIMCGKIAKQKLEELIGHNELKCDIETKARSIGDLGFCHAGDININREMVSRGYAAANIRDGEDFIDEEIMAKKLKLGFWAGEFQNSEDWNREDYQKEMGGIKKVDFLCTGDFKKSKALQSCSNKSKGEIGKIKDEYFEYKKILVHYIIDNGYMQFNEKTYKDDIPLDINEVAFGFYDINADGEKEILFNTFEKGYCGSAGCSFEILKKDNEGKWYKLEMPNIDIDGIYMSEGATALGYKDFILQDGWGGANVWRWNGKEYDYYKKIYNLMEK